MERMSDEHLDRAREIAGATPGGTPLAKALEVAKARRRQPSMATLERWADEGIAQALDGCWVEPDGTCEHGSPSWLLKLGLI